MRSFAGPSIVLLASLIASATALDGIVTPPVVAAGQEFQVTFQGASNDQFRVYLAASLASSNGPTCYLINSTSLSSPLSLSIPPDVGPSADYYSISVGDLTTKQGPTFSNLFNLTGGTGNYTEYENHLGGSPFWSADDLPCSAYACARQCAAASYPGDLTNQNAYNTMISCMLKCKGVEPAPSQTAPAHASASSTSAAASGATSSQHFVTSTITNGATITREIAASATSKGAAPENRAYRVGIAAVGFAGLAFIV